MSISKIQEYITDHVPIPVELLYNFFYTALLLLCLTILKRMILRKIFSKNPTPGLRSLIDDLAPSLLNFIAIGLLLNLWVKRPMSLSTLFNLGTDNAARILATTYVLIFYLAAKKIVTAAISFFDIPDVQKQYSIAKYSSITIGAISFGLLIKIWFAEDSDLSTYFGLLSAGLAIALQDMIASVAGWIYLISVKPFSVGERIKIGDHTGDVADIKTFHFSLEELTNTDSSQQPTGRIIHIPNRDVFRSPIANYNAGFNYIWHEIPVMVTFESDWKKAEAIIDVVMCQVVERRNYGAEREIKQAARSLHMSLKNMESKVWISVADSGVVITMRFLCDPAKKRQISSKIWTEILKAFAGSKDIDFAYPTQRFYDNHAEGKHLTG